MTERQVSSRPRPGCDRPAARGLNCRVPVDLFGEPISEPRGAGRPRHVPTEAQRCLVAAMHRDGHRQPAIAKRLGITVPTLLLNYAVELDSTSRTGRRRQLRDQKRNTEIGRK